MLCGSRVPWGEALLSLPPTAESADPTTGQPLLRGLSAKVGIFHGPITRLTPHAVSGQLLQCLLIADFVHCCMLQPRCSDLHTSFIGDVRFFVNFIFCSPQKSAWTALLLSIVVPDAYVCGCVCPCLSVCLPHSCSSPDASWCSPSYPNCDPALQHRQ